MNARAYYNEIDPEAVAVLRQLIAEDIIMPGDVDNRSIKEVQPSDLRGYTQCHFFAGAGLWSVSARRAGWPDRRPLWSGSCPCQGESLAGKRRGADDPRHLWPDFFRLIRAKWPAVVVGEQVAAAAGTHWLDGTCSDLESEFYTARAVNIPACSVDAPHIRQRLYWLAVADADSGRREDWLNRMGESSRPPREEWRQQTNGLAGHDPEDSRTDDLADGDTMRQQQSERFVADERRWLSDGDARGVNGSRWADAEWINYHDGKARRAKPGIRMLVDGLAGRIGLWRLAGNSIVPELGAEVLAAFLEDEAEQRLRLALTSGVFA